MRRALRAAAIVVAFAAVGVAGRAYAQHGGEARAADGHGAHGGDVAHAATAAHAGEHEEGGAAHEGGHHEPHWSDINVADIFDRKSPALVSLFINFGLLVGLYYMLGKKPIVEGLKQRRITIGKDIEDAQKMLGEAQERAKKYQGDLKNADADAATAKATLVAAGKGEVERLLVEAQERADRMKRDADRLVEQETKQREQDLLRETVERAVGEATRLIERSVKQDDHLRLANDLLAELARVPARGPASVVPTRGAS